MSSAIGLDDVGDLYFRVMETEMCDEEQERELLIEDIKSKLEMILNTDVISEEEKIVLVERALGKVKGSFSEEGI